MIKFTKMHGIGNDYIYIDARKDKIANPKKLAIAMSKPHFGIGADGIILILDSTKADFQMRIFNADGSEAEMCGNGIRCFGKYVYEHKLTKKTEMTIETKAGLKNLVLTITNGLVKQVTVDMGEPVLERNRIPMIGEKGTVIDERIEVEGVHFDITAVSIGNPHVVIYVEDVKNFPVTKYGPIIENHELFPKRTNVEFVQVINENEVIQRTWERGSGETLACGTGASAVTVAGLLTGKNKRNLTVHLTGGDLKIKWDQKTNHIFKTGPAVEVFSGIWPE